MPTGNITDPLSLNYYTYSANNPVMYCDPSGNVWETVFDVVTLGLSIAEALAAAKELGIKIIYKIIQ